MQESFAFLPKTESASDTPAKRRPMVDGWCRPADASTDEQPDAADIARGSVRLLDTMGFRALTEMRLASGRRVDAIGLDGRGRFAIVEVKSSLADLRADEKWPEYLPYCDWYYFAVAPMDGAVRRRQTLLFAHTASARLSRLLESGL